MQQALFNDGRLSESLNSFYQSISQKVNEIPKDQFMVSSDEDVIEHLYSRMAVDPLLLHLDHRELTQEEIQIDVSNMSGRNPFNDPGPLYFPGSRQIVSIPFSGDLALWKLRPNLGSSVIPHAGIRLGSGAEPNQVEIVVDSPIDTSVENIKQEVERQISLIIEYINSQKSEIKEFNEKLKGEIRNSINSRRQRLQGQEGIANALNIPLKRREGAPNFQPIKVEKILVQPLPPPPQKGYAAEPGIAQEVYEDVLRIIRHVAITFETTPATFHKHDEEELRDILLANLNGLYQGGATGETFRKAGKTDIRIESGDRAAFIAECKVWKGVEELAGGIDQLLDYLTWRDGKCSLIIFNKHNAKFSELIEKVPSVFLNHPSFVRDMGKQADGEWRYTFNTKDDEGRRDSTSCFSH